MKYRYSVDEEDFENSYLIDMKLDYDDDIDFVAEKCAEDYHSNHDGWECSWPCDFFIFSERGALLGKYSVEIQPVPQFNAVRQS